MRFVSSVVLSLVGLLVLSACGESELSPSAPVCPSPKPVSYFSFRNIAFYPPSGTTFDISYPTDDWDKELTISGDFTPTKPAEIAPAAIGIVLVCDEGANGLAVLGGGVHTYPDVLFPQSVSFKSWVASISYEPKSHNWDFLECSTGHEVNAIFIVSQQNKTWRDLTDTGWSNKIRWEYVAHKQFIPIGWKVTG